MTHVHAAAAASGPAGWLGPVSVAGLVLLFAIWLVDTHIGWTRLRRDPHYRAGYLQARWSIPEKTPSRPRTRRQERARIDGATRGDRDRANSSPSPVSTAILEPNIRRAVQEAADTGDFATVARLLREGEADRIDSPDESVLD